MEFVTADRFPTDRRSAVRWIFSYARHYWLIGLVMLGGAVGNAALAAVVPILVCQAFQTLILQSHPRPMPLFSWRG